ncbi:MAG: Stp1/IreP family PP2C-type Ser/Thr phosphatase [Christensenellales bacterium]
MNAVWRTDVGRVRSSNQDAFLVLPGDHPLYAVADGMGGHLGGDIASAMAIEGLKKELAGEEPSPDLISRCVDRISAAIFRRQLHDRALSGMGTTLTLLWEAEDQVHLGHVGDSRAYLLREGKLRQLSTDHSLVSELLRSGALDEASAGDYPYRNVITRAVGTQEAILCDTAAIDKLPGDRFLLCSDGLSEYIKRGQLQDLLQGGSLEQTADTLLALALERGGRDNITLILLEVGA